MHYFLNFKYFQTIFLCGFHKRRPEFKGRKNQEFWTKPLKCVDMGRVGVKISNFSRCLLRKPPKEDQVSILKRGIHAKK